MNQDQQKFERAIQAFDTYNSKDPSTVTVDKREVPYNLLYGQRMSKMLVDYTADANEALRLAARCQHIGRWEIPRKDFPMNRKGYLKWRSTLKIHHADIASKILKEEGYDDSTIQKVKDLLMKKRLKQDPDCQALEDVICLVFLKYYFDDFSSEHEDEKLVNILQKTIQKMSERGIGEAMNLPLSARAKDLISKATEQ
jgi:hypothetical protein